MKHTDEIIGFVNELSDFSYELSCLDFVWNILFPDNKKKWQHLHINKYKNTFYMTHVAGEGIGIGNGSQTIEVSGSSYSCGADHNHLSIEWNQLITSARNWLKFVRRDWISANKQVQSCYPLSYRYGIVPHTLIRASLPDWYRLDKELGRNKTGKFIRLIEDGYFHKAENTEIASLTADDYFRYCKIAYIAGKRKDEEVNKSLSGREMYILYADGRHEGLLDINPTSEQEFADWIEHTHPNRSVGGHPWEIKRGGNTTHIDLMVYRPSPYQQKVFKIELSGESIGRMVETIRMFLAIQEANLPIAITDPEGVRKRLLAQDNIGIVPSYASLHRAKQDFGKDKVVYDVMYYDDLGRFKRRITPFVTWEPLPILKPKDA
ncbi:MAG: hypothetical protein HQL10_00965 [Nitrospirae bacterium]|nr:hypothetical protein [Nitrospirota bacterium]